jgi:hypothetical protein
MSCNHTDVTAESNQYHEGHLVCFSCGLVVSPGHLVSESSSPSLEPTRTPPELADHLYDRSKFFIRWVRKHNQEKFKLENEEVILVTQVYRAFCNFYFKEIAPHVARTYVPPTRWLVPRIMEDVLGLDLPDAGRCQIKTPSILADFDTWWGQFFSYSKNENT